MLDEGKSSGLLTEMVALLSRGCLDEARRLFLDNEQQLPASMRSEGLGNLAFYQRDLQAAVDHYEAAIRLRPDRVIARYQYLVGTQMERSGDLVSAFKRYQAAIDTDPNFLDAYIELGGLLAKVGDFAGSAQCYRDACRIAPDDAYSLFNLKTVLSQLVNQDQERYGPELREVEAALEEITRGQSVQPVRKYSW